MHSRRKAGATLPHEESIRYPAVVATRVQVAPNRGKPRTRGKVGVCKIYDLETGAYKGAVASTRKVDRDRKPTREIYNHRIEQRNKLLAIAGNNSQVD